MDAERLARGSLHADAAYCAAAGLGTIVLANRIAATIGVPTNAVRAAGAGTVAWAGIVAVLARRSAWQRPTAMVMAANLGTSSGLLLWAATHRTRSARILLAVIATEVGAFGAIQAVALRGKATA